MNAPAREVSPKFESAMSAVRPTLDEAEDTVRVLLRWAGDDPDRDYFNVGLGLAAVFPNGWITFVDFQVLLGYRDRDGYRLTAGLRKEL